MEEKNKKPCRVCDNFGSWRQRQASDEQRQKAAKAATATAIASTTTATANNTSSSSSSMAAYQDPQTGQLQCPPDSFALGNATWTFLHTTAAYYPDDPTPGQRFAMRQMLNGLGQLYPCGECADHLRQRLRTDPPAVENSFALSQWLCRVHNEVNERLGKAPFDCARVDERWRDGPEDGSCD